MNPRICAFALAGCLLLAGSTALADDRPAPAGQPLWEFKLAAFGQNFPAYPSAADQNLTLLPLPIPVYHGRFLRFGEDLEDVASGQLLKSDRLDLSLSLSADFPADSDELSDRRGMPDLGLLLEAGPELKVRLQGDRSADRELTLSLQLRAAVSFDDLHSKGRGAVFNPEIEYLARDVFGSRTEWRFRVSPTWASRDYTDFSYGVAPEFATPDRPAFEASGGYVNTEILFGLNRRITDRLEFRGSVRLWFNQGSANEQSPLYQRDIDRGIRLALFWTAWQSKQRR